MNADPSPKNRTGQLLVFFIVLALAASTIYAVRTSYVLRYELKQAHDELAELKGEVSSTKDAPTPDFEALRRELAEKEKRVAALRQQLAQQAQAEAQPAIVAPTNTVDNTTTNAATGERRSWLDRLREQNPERYKQIMEAREERRQRVDAFFQEQFDRLDERYAVARTQEEAELITQIADTLGRVEELRGQWEQIRQLPDEQRREAARKLGQESWETYQTLIQLRERDRQLQIRNLASQIGYRTPEEVEQFAQAIDRVYRETDTSMRRFMGWGGGGNP